jgi:hypothetical protein
MKWPQIYIFDFLNVSTNLKISIALGFWFQFSVRSFHFSIMLKSYFWSLYRQRYCPWHSMPAAALSYPCPPAPGTQIHRVPSPQVSTDLANSKFSNVNST